jgi:hypothetical protein
MATIGNTLQTQGFSPAVDYFSGNGSTVAFTLSRPVASVSQVQAVIENVPQNPGTAYTVSGSTITFTSAPPSGTNNIYVYYTSPITSVATLSQAPSVQGPMLVAIGGGAALGGTTNPITAMAGASSNYVQSYVINQTNGSSSSADFVAYPSNGTDAHGWVDMGITSLGYADTTYTVTGPNEAYIFGSAPSGSGTTGNLVYATDSTGSANAHQFYVGGFTQAKGAYKAQITSTALQLGTSVVLQNSSGRPILNQTGSILQVVQATNNTASTVSGYNAFGTNNSTPVVTSGYQLLSASITPSSTSSTILILSTTYVGMNADLFADSALFRGSTYLAIAETSRAFSSVNTIQLVDSPASTSAQTYQIRIGNNNGGNMYINQGTAGGGGWTYNSGIKSTLILMEIAG